MLLRRFAVLQSVLIVLWLSVAGAYAASPTVKQPQVDTPKRVLFVGNSYLYYNNSMHNHVRRLLAAADPAAGKLLQYKSSTIGGARLSHHNIEYSLNPAGSVSKSCSNWASCTVKA